MIKCVLAMIIFVTNVAFCHMNLAFSQAFYWNLVQDDFQVGEEYVWETKKEDNFGNGMICVKTTFPLAGGSIQLISVDGLGELDIADFEHVPYNQIYSEMTIGTRSANFGNVNHVALSDMEHPYYHANEYCIIKNDEKIIWMINDVFLCQLETPVYMLGDMYLRITMLNPKMNVQSIRYYEKTLMHMND